MREHCPWLELALGVLLMAGVWLRYLSIAAAAILGTVFYRDGRVVLSAARESIVDVSALASRYRQKRSPAMALC